MSNLIVIAALKPRNKRGPVEGRCSACGSIVHQGEGRTVMGKLLCPGCAYGYNTVESPKLPKVIDEDHPIKARKVA